MMKQVGLNTQTSFSTTCCADVEGGEAGVTPPNQSTQSDICICSEV